MDVGFSRLAVSLTAGGSLPWSSVSVPSLQNGSECPIPGSWLRTFRPVERQDVVVGRQGEGVRVGVGGSWGRQSCQCDLEGGSLWTVTLAMDVQFRDIRVCSDRGVLPWNRGPKQEILKGVSGIFKNGELSAILGPSGAGKTTLLNAISGYKKVGLSGRLLVNGEDRVEHVFQKLSCYITQEDLLLPLLTLDELMGFASTLKLPPHYSTKQRRAVVDEIQALLGLTEARHTFTDRLSGGQKRRLSIALELINNPQILFLDEPTSGLDTVAAAHLIRLMSQLAKGGRTIVCTIHQPSASLFEIFDLVYFIGGGRCVYQGAPGQHLVNFLIEHKLSCPEYYNPADYIIELMEDEKNIEILSQATENGTATWVSKDVILPNCSKIENRIGSSNFLQYGNFRDETESHPCSEKLSFWIQFSTLFQRMVLQQRRNKVALNIQFYHHVGCALGVGIVFHNKARDANEFFTHMKFCVGIILFHTYTQCMVPVLSYPFHVKLLKKEYFNQWYQLLPYYMAHAAAYVPPLCFFSLLFLTIVYTFAGLPWEILRFSVFSAVGIMTALVAEAMGLTISSIFSVTNGSIIGPLSVAPFFGLSLYGLDFARTVPPFMKLFVRISFMKEAVSSLIMAVFSMDRERLECNDPLFCPFTDPKVALYYLNLENDSIWDHVLNLLIILCVFRLSFYYALKWRLR